MSEEVFCPDCDKELSEEKGELAHGCLDCHGTIQSEKLFWYRKEITKLKKALELANTQLAILLENAECREDEDCDHCMAIGAQKQIKEVLEGE